MSDNVLTRALQRLDDASRNAHATAPVPDAQSAPAYRVALICVGVAFTLTSLYTSSELAQGLGWHAGLLAVFYGSLILALMSVPAAMVGARTRLSTYMIVSRVFGTGGSRAINLVLGVVLLGWYAVTAELFGRTFYLAATLYFPAGPPQAFYTVLVSAVVTGTTVFGFRAIDRLSLAAAPLLVVLTLYVAWAAAGAAPAGALAATVPQGMDLGTGISAVVGGLIVGVVLMPDITRFSRSTLDCAVISFFGNGVGGGVALACGLIPAIVFHEVDPMKYMATLGLVAIPFVVLVVSTWTMNAVNLYSTGLVTSTALPRVSYGRIVVACGIAGTALGVVGIADRLIDFLVYLGLIVPPIASVYLADFFLLGRHGPGEAGEEQRANINALLACLVGALTGVAMYQAHASLTGVPSIESFATGAIAYVLLERLRSRLGRNRLWR